jgi:hypothetical protein
MGSFQRPLTQAIVASLLATGAAAQEQSDDLLFPRLTIEAPLITRHVPQDEGYHDHNWGAFVDLDVVKHFGLAGGYFINSFRRDTAFAGVTFTPFYIELPNAELDAFATIASDLNGGYKGNNKLDPLLGAVSIRLTGTHFDGTPLQFLNDVGVAVTVVPPITAINLAVTYTIPLR